ncbi:unnamed protein product [Polarella glacialis]|uniref:Uncharacterized protein n=1 Tax=Polarella glacialis TaxID=89957 RepID=A0A813KUQ2_POLGL|nr:unnamed protein product [Polarella glacialis]
MLLELTVGTAHFNKAPPSPLQITVSITFFHGFKIQLLVVVSDALAVVVVAAAVVVVAVVVVSAAIDAGVVCLCFLVCYIFVRCDIIACKLGVLLTHPRMQTYSCICGWNDIG